MDNNTNNFNLFYEKFNEGLICYKQYAKNIVRIFKSYEENLNQGFNEDDIDDLGASFVDNEFAINDYYESELFSGDKVQTSETILNLIKYYNDKENSIVRLDESYSYNNGNSFYISDFDIEKTSIKKAKEYIDKLISNKFNNKDNESYKYTSYNKYGKEVETKIIELDNEWVGIKRSFIRTFVNYEYKVSVTLSFNKKLSAVLVGVSICGKFK